MLIPILSGDQQVPIIGPALLLLMLPIVGVLAVILPGYLLYLSLKKLYKIQPKELEAGSLADAVTCRIGARDSL